MKDNRRALSAPVLIGVGAAFDLVSGTKRQAPAWLQRAGLEWLFRLLTEPLAALEALRQKQPGLRRRHRPPPAPDPPRRMRVVVDGKFFALGETRFHFRVIACRECRSRRTLLGTSETIRAAGFTVISVGSSATPGN